ncbi:MAG: domain containing protein [Schlesneria sp.]|nr:domain containing protein [Schlesneria sp.]
MPTDDSSPPPLKAGYVISIIVLTLGSFALYSVAPTLIAVALHWPITFTEVFQSSIPLVDHSVMSQGKLYVPNLSVNPFNPVSSRQSLTVFDLASGESREIGMQKSAGQIDLVADESGLWGVNGSTVIRIQSDEVQETSSGTTISNEPIFIYEGKLATIIDSPSIADDSLPTSHLHVWTGSTWQKEGRVLLPPTASAELTADESEGAAKELNSLLGFGGVVEIKVVNANGQIHLFCSDGTNVLYSNKLELIPERTASALVTENAPTPLSNWISAGIHPKFQVGADAQGPLLAAKKSTGEMKTKFSISRLTEGAWKQSIETEQSGFVLTSKLVSDGQTAYLVSQTLGNKLSLAEIQADGTKTSKLSLKTGLMMERLTQTISKFWWVAFIVMLIYAVLVTWLMNAYCSSRYEYGNSTVELAPFLRRVLAKGVDWLLIMGPIVALQWTFIGSQAEAQEWWMEKFSELDLNIMKMLVFGVLGLLLYFVTWLFVLGIGEGVWGISPGKWLFGLRVVRTTLRPCGLLRAMFREILLLIDAVLCFGWLPAAFTVTLSRFRQRVGDFAADTIVIRKPVLDRLPADSKFTNS